MKQAPETAENEEPIDWDRIPQAPVAVIDYPQTFFNRLRRFGVGRPGEKVLDVGTGTGMLSRGIARQGCEVTGIDVSERRLELARRFADHQGLSIEFRSAFAENTGLKNRRFDLIAASNAWWYFEPAETVREMGRLLRPQGRLLICGYRPLADRQDIARKTQDLLRQYDIEADEPDHDGEIPALPQSTRDHFAVTGRFLFEEELCLTRDQWRWQILSRPDVACNLTPQEQDELDQRLGGLVPPPGESFEITYRMYAVILASGDLAADTDCHVSK